MNCLQDENNRKKCQSVQPADLLMVQPTVHEIHGPKIKYTESLFIFYLRPDDKIKLKYKFYLLRIQIKNRKIYNTTTVNI